MTIAVVPIAQATAERLRCSVASAMQEPTGGSVIVVLPTLIASEATTKNQLPDIESIMLKMSCGIANGTASRQNRINGDRRNTHDPSTSSTGTVRSDW